MRTIKRRTFLKNSTRGAIGALGFMFSSGTFCSSFEKNDKEKEMVIDSHAHLFPKGMDKVGTADMLIEQMDECGVDRAVILGIYPRVMNEFIAEQARAHPDRFIGFASVNPNDGKAAIDLLDRCVKEYGLKGLKIHPPMQKFKADDFELLTPLMHKVEELNIPMLIHSWAWHGGQNCNSRSSRILNLAEKFPNITFIMAHCGGMRFMDLLILSRWRQLGKWNNLYVDISNILFDVANSPIASQFRWTLEKIGLDRVLMGSDFPDYTLKDTIRLTKSLDFKKDGLKQVVGKNAARLLGIREIKNA